ncbi:dephospho-CoA kinase [Arthrobacter cupressi]|uniref:Dephospho-CoA kinase n=1 Tax=Arthrobacter cupressi TaxID=1045773 RepID=A0A1G8TEA4_9MICC|nr:dephospho-CoA kinase [Arthrobacter cupressi]NYD79766.1 dephospho-CoA kinase [Arthrobacter cupressi]SDJ39932.1 dephospho-CoA kinase [Arthrobacter cupressi]
MLKIGLTGGIASGKSLVAQRFRELGAVLVDADVIAREVVEPGTEGLRRIVEAFGPDIVDPDGRLDRARLGGIVFADPGRREVLNGIVHPLVRGRAAELLEEAAAGEIVVQDIPLLVETGQGSSFHLVVVVDAPEELRVHRMTSLRGMAEAEARSRIAAQASRAERLAAADVVLENSGSRDGILAQVDRLWEERLLPFAENLASGRRAERPGGARLLPPDPAWPAVAERLAARIRKAAPELLAVDHIGSTAVPELHAKNVIDLQLTVDSLATADALAPALGAAGFPPVPGTWRDTAKPGSEDPALWQKRLHANADPGQPANIHVRVAGSPGWRFALLFRDWLRSDAEARASYAVEKERLAAQFADDAGTARYAEAKEPWFTEQAQPRMEAWAENTGWRPPSYS